jgi:hypothetical protein
MRYGIVGLAAVLAVAGTALAQENPRQESQRQEIPPRSESPRQEPPRQELPDQERQDVFRQGAGAPHQHGAHRRLSQADLNALTDARIGIAKAMLQMTPDQARLWPPVEEAIRNAAEARYRRIAQFRAMMDRGGEHEPDPIAIMRGRADALSERSANLRKLADAWQPLYQTLNPDQRERLRLVASHVLNDARGLLEHRHAERFSGMEEGEE